MKRKISPQPRPPKFKIGDRVALLNYNKQVTATVTSGGKFELPVYDYLYELNYFLANPMNEEAVKHVEFVNLGLWGEDREWEKDLTRIEDDDLCELQSRRLDWAIGIMRDHGEQCLCSECELASRYYLDAPADLLAEKQRMIVLLHGTGQDRGCE